MPATAEQRAKWGKRKRARYAAAMRLNVAKGRAAQGIRDWTPREVSELERCVKRGLTSKQIMDRFEGRRPRQGVLLKLKKLGLLDRCRTNVYLTDDEKALVLRLARDERLTRWMIADRTGIHADTIKHFLKREGVKPVPVAEFEADKRRVGFIRGWLKAERGEGDGTGA